MLQLVIATRSWHVLVRIGSALLAVVVATALQWPIEVDVPGKPFLIYFIAVVIVSIFLGRIPGFLTVAGTSLASLLYAEPLYSFKVSQAIDLLAIEGYTVVAAVSAEAFCRLVAGALAEKSEASSARAQQQEAQARVFEIELINRSLAESEQRFRATFENAAVGISHFNPDGRWLMANETMCRIMGWPADELVTKSFQELTHPEDIGVEIAKFEQLLAGKIDNYSVEKRSERKDGTIVWIRRTVSCVRQYDGSIDYLVSVVEDISERKRTEELLRRQADLLDQSHDAIFTWKIGNGIVYWNRGAERMYGYSREEVIGRVSHELLHTQSDISSKERELRTLREGSWYGDLTHTSRDGHEIVVESRHVRVSYDGETYALETNRDVTARKHAEEELRKSEERFRSSILHSPVPTILFDDREEILAVSQNWLKAAGGSAAELRRMEDWTTRAYGERSDEILELIRGTIATAPETQQAEQMILTYEGDKRIWNFITSGLGTQSDGRRLFVSVAQDVTDQRAYEERVNLLMREARHRLKNVLSLVQAIARQTAAGGAVDFIHRFIERIQALAANQDLLVRHEWRRIDVKDLVQGQLGHFGDLSGTRLNLDGPKLYLNAAAAQAIGLAIHELGTNAGKYGALSTDAGEVEVSWHLDDDTFGISWVERNGPPVCPPEHCGFGSTVIDSMVKQTLSGEVELDYAPSGLRWRLTCRAADALEGAGSSSQVCPQR